MRATLIFGLVFAFFLLIFCPGSAQAAAPTITNLSITTGAVGATVTVTGTNFGSTKGTSTVKFNGTTAATTTWTSTSIVTTVTIRHHAASWSPGSNLQQREKPCRRASQACRSRPAQWGQR